MISALSITPPRANCTEIGQAVPVLMTTTKVALKGELQVPAHASGIVLFAHGSGSSRHSVRNRMVARTLHRAGIGTLLFDLLTPEEEMQDLNNGFLRFDIPLLTQRLMIAAYWLHFHPLAKDLPYGFFGASTGAAAALQAAAELGTEIRAVVSRGGRPDLAIRRLPDVKSPTLLIVGGNDELVLKLNQRAYQSLTCEKRLEIIPRATHLFEEPGTLEQAASLAADWFTTHFQP